MKKRIKKKGECAHYYYGDPFLVTDDPYPIYNSECYCKLGKFDYTWSSPELELPCKKCKRFKLSMAKQRENVRKYKEWRRESKLAERYEKVHPQDDFMWFISKDDLETLLHF